MNFVLMEYANTNHAKDILIVRTSVIKNVEMSAKGSFASQDVQAQPLVKYAIHTTTAISELEKFVHKDTAKSAQIVPRALKNHALNPIINATVNKFVCPPCVDTVPMVNSVHKEYALRNFPNPQ